MKTLHLTLKKQWFDMISSGEKKEEYREIKPYWIKRLTTSDCQFREFDRVVFKNGYSSNAPSIELECLGIQEGEGMMTWGAESDKKYFVISLGEIIQKRL